MIYFTAHTFKCVCHCRKAMFRVLGMYNFGGGVKKCQIIRIFFFIEEYLEYLGALFSINIFDHSFFLLMHILTLFESDPQNRKQGRQITYYNDVLVCKVYSSQEKKNKIKQTLFC